MLITSEHLWPKGKHALRWLLAMLAAVGLVAGLLQIPIVRAQEGAGNDPIPVAGIERGEDFITSATLARGSDKTKTSPLVAAEGVEFKFTWDASQYYGTPKAAKPGDTITVTLPSWAQFAPGTVDMKDDNNLVVGTCEQTSRQGTNDNVTAHSKVVCTLNDKVTNRSGLKGNFASSIWLIETKKINPTSFPVGPINVVADLASVADQDVIDKGIIKNVPNLTNDRLTDQTQQLKTGIFHGVIPLSEGKAIIEWIMLAKGTGGDITIRDAFSSPQIKAAYVDNKNNIRESTVVRVRDAKTEGEAGGHWNLTTDAAPGTASVFSTDLYRINWTEEVINGENKNVATVVIPNSEPGKWYRASIYTQVDPDYFRNGDQISNTASINDEEKSRTLTAKNMISAYGEGKLGFGDVYVFKNIRGVDAADVPAGYTANIKAEITYPDQRKETKMLQVKPGSDPLLAGKLSQLPHLTTVTLTEENAGEIPGFTLDSTAFGEGKSGTNVPQSDVVIAPDKSSVTVTVRNAGVTEIGVNNTYTKEAKKYGVLNLKKNVANAVPAAAVAKAYELTYTCDADSKDGSYTAGTSTTVEVADGETKSVGEFPVGTNCAVDENDANVAGFNWTKSPAQNIVIAEGTGETVNLATVTNTYTEQLGSLKISKAVNIEPASAADNNEFVFAVRCERAMPAVVKEYELKLRAGEEKVIASIPAGSTCTVTETPDSAKIAGYTWTVDQEDVKVNITENAEAVVDVVNSYAKDVGKLVVVKTVSAAATAGVSDKTFDFSYRCEQKDLGEIIEGQISGVTVGETRVVEGIPAGSECVVVEKDADHPLTSWKVEGGASKTVTVDKNRDGLAQFHNVYTELTGQIQVSKRLVGSAAELPELRGREFEAKYSCMKNGAELNGAVKFSADKSTVVSNIPLGAVCTFTEVTAGLDNLAGLRFDVTKSTVTSEVVLPTADSEKDQMVEVELVNYFDELGRVTLKKVVKGLGARFASGQQFPVTASWQLDGQEPVTREFVVKDGEVYDQLPQLPVGTVVTLTETLPKDGALTAWRDPKYSGAGVKDLDDAMAEVTIQSGTYDAAVEVELANKANPPLWWIPLLAIPFLPQPPAPNNNPPADQLATPTAEPSTHQAPAKGQPVQQQNDKQNNKGALANTGASVLWILLVGLLSAVIGAILFSRARRES